MTGPRSVTCMTMMRAPTSLANLTAYVRPASEHSEKSTGTRIVRIIRWAARVREVDEVFILVISRMTKRQMTHCINKALNERSDCDQQSREKEHWMNYNAEPDCERRQQSCRNWFHNCEEHFFH